MPHRRHTGECEPQGEIVGEELEYISLKAPVRGALKATDAYNPDMDLHAELARFNPDPELANWIAGAVQKFVDQAQEEATESARLSE